MTTYRAKRLDGITALQRRRFFLIWTTLAYGAWAVMSARAIRLQRQSEKTSTTKRKHQ